jgi:hypothetical protein
MIEKTAYCGLAEAGGGSAAEVPADAAKGSAERLSDEKLFSLCKNIGARALEARQKFLGLLPEVNRRELVEKLKGKSWLARRGFPDIFVFAKKLAGVNDDQVRLILNLKIRFEDKPALQAMLVNGEVSANKLARVVSIATVENQEALAEQVKILPKSALETLVRDLKHSTVNGLGEPFFGLPGQTALEDCNKTGESQFFKNSEPIHGKAATSGELLSMKINLKLDNDVVSELHELQGKGINISEILRKALDGRREEIVREKEKLAESAEEARGATVVSETGEERETVAARGAEVEARPTAARKTIFPLYFGAR